MNAHVAAWGRLNMDLELRTTKAGTAWSPARMAIAMPQPYGADEDASPPTLQFAITTFGHATDELLRHPKDECVFVAVRLGMRPYKSRGGEPREGWTCIADSVIGSRSPRPRGGAKNNPGNGGAGVQPAANPDPAHVPPDDPIGS